MQDDTLTSGTDMPHGGIRSPHKAPLGLTLMFVLAIIYALLAVALVGNLFFQRYKEEVKNGVQDELGAIADLKIMRINEWMGERRSDALILGNDPIFLEKAANWLRGGGKDEEARAALLGRMTLLQQKTPAAGYRSITLLDAQGKPRLSTAPEGFPVIDLDVQHVLREGKMMLHDLHRAGGLNGGQIEFELAAPLLKSDARESHPIGVILFSIDPERFLFPLIRQWPTSSPSAETLLVRRENDTMLYLNELRHREHTALKLRLPLTQTNLLAVRASRGEMGFMEGTDYRGVEVVGAARPVHDTPWLMLSKVDRDEIYAPIDRLSAWLGALLLILLACGGAAAFYWHRQTEKLRHARLEQLTLAKHLEFLGKYANDITLLIDRTGRIIEFNENAPGKYGYSSEEFSKLSIADLRAEDTPPLAERQHEIDHAEALRFESTHIRRDGSIFPVEVSVHTMSIGGERYYQAVHRDISERQLMQRTLQESEEKFRLISSTAQDAVLMMDDAGRICFWNEAAEKIFGHSAAEAIGQDLHALIVPERYRTAFAKNLPAFLQTGRGGALGNIQEVMALRKDWTEFPVEMMVSPLRLGDRWHATGFIRDISERKAAKAALLWQKDFLYQIIDNDPNLIYVKDAAGKYRMANRALAAFYGKPVNEIIGRTEAELDPELRGIGALLAPLAAEPAASPEVVAVAPALLPDGKPRWYLTLHQPLTHPDGQKDMLHIAVNITAQKQSELRQATAYRELQRLASHLDNVRENERLRIARELHDEMGAILAALKMRAAWLAARIPAELTPLSTEAENISGLIANGISTMRNVVGKLRPGPLEEMSLDEAIEDCVQRFRRNTDCACTLELPEEELNLDNERSSALYRILQEALSNVAQHAQARQVTVRIGLDDDTLSLLVEDDGIGFSGKIGDNSFGLLGIRERALMAGGKASIVSKPGNGTRVTVTFPQPAVVRHMPPRARAAQFMQRRAHRTEALPEEEVNRDSRADSR